MQTYHLYENCLIASSGNKLSQISALVNLFGGLWWGFLFDAVY